MNQQINCPAINDWWTVDLFRPFYQGKRDELTGSDTPASTLETGVDSSGKEFAIYQEKTWRPSGIQVIWTPGLIVDPWPETIWGSDHWHTTFTITNHLIHIDFISFNRSGPPMSYREYRVFCDGEEIKRGGGYAGFLMGNFSGLNNWPLVAKVEDYLIYIKKLLQFWASRSPGKIVDDPVCSIWQLEQKS